MSEEIKKKAAPKKEAKPAADPAAKVAPAAATAPGAPAAVIDPTKPPEAPVVAAPTAAELLGEDPNAKKIIKAKHAKNVVAGVANILATFNNTQVTITDNQGNLIGWSSAGRVGFKGSRKSTAYAAQQVAQDAKTDVKDVGKSLKGIKALFLKAPDGSLACKQEDETACNDDQTKALQVHAASKTPPVKVTREVDKPAH